MQISSWPWHRIFCVLGVLTIVIGLCMDTPNEELLCTILVEVGLILLLIAKMLASYAEIVLQQQNVSPEEEKIVREAILETNCKYGLFSIGCFTACLYCIFIAVFLPDPKLIRFAFKLGRIGIYLMCLGSFFENLERISLWWISRKNNKKSELPDSEE